MATLGTSARCTARITSSAGRNVRRKLDSASQRRIFSRFSPQWAAHNFVMPAMSPTMTEGNISSWKVKEGETFSTGDILLEIETDKATMDVEAQDDGVMAKIIQQAGAKSVKVGSRIAVLADPGDDVSALEIPAEEPQAESPAAKASSSEQPPETPPTDVKAEQLRKETSARKPSSPSSPPQPQKYPLYPSVEHLIHEHNISESDIPSIEATGPGGRLLKGDVLSFIGQIDKDYSSSLSQRLEKLSHLDLSNIKVKPAAPRAAPSTATKPPIPEVPETIQIAVPISLHAVHQTQHRIEKALHLDLPLSTFIARASAIANESLPRARIGPPTADELFDAVLGLDKLGPRTSRGHYTPEIIPLDRPAIAFGPVKKPDIIDELTSGGRIATVQPPSSWEVETEGEAAENVFSVTARRGEERRVRTYLERMKTVLEAEPARCVL